jgi:GDPmannose 4,6-dehydratase
MLQNKKPNDFVISTGKQYSIRDFINICFKHLNIEVTWRGSNLKEVAIIKSFKDRKYKLKKDQIIIKVNKKYFRPTEVNNLLGDSAKAEKELGWKNKINIKELVSEMLDNDLKKYQININ